MTADEKAREKLYDDISKQIYQGGAPYGAEWSAILAQLSSAEPAETNKRRKDFLRGSWFQVAGFTTMIAPALLYGFLSMLGTKANWLAVVIMPAMLIGIALLLFGVALKRDYQKFDAARDSKTRELAMQEMEKKYPGIAAHYKRWWSAHVYSNP